MIIHNFIKGFIYPVKYCFVKDLTDMAARFAVMKNSGLWADTHRYVPIFYTKYQEHFGIDWFHYEVPDTRRK
jgi:hypothetical protein